MRSRFLLKFGGSPGKVSLRSSSKDLGSLPLSSGLQLLGFRV